MKVEQALVVAEPWVSKIIGGEKVWEMRSTPNSKSGWVGLIRKGSGLIVGAMKINVSQGPFTKEQLHSHFEKHKVGPELINSETYKWFYAWQITNVKRFDFPVRYNHPNGAVIWVNLDEAAQTAVQKQLGVQPESVSSFIEKSAIDAQVDAELNKLFGQAASSAAVLLKEPVQKAKQYPYKPVISIDDAKLLQKSSAPATVVKAPTKPLAPSLMGSKSISVVLTQGNISNNHFYLPREGEFFPAAMWGGNNKSCEGAKGLFQFHGIEHPVETDIDGSKRILRSRGAIGAFFKLHKLSAGDEVVIIRNSDFSFGVEFKKIAGVK